MIFVIDVGGLAVAAFSAETDIDAAFFAGEEHLRTDLMMCRDPATKKPIWDGETALHVRRALDTERAKWEAARARRMIVDGVIDHLGEYDDLFLTFLVPIEDDDRPVGDQ